MRYIFGGLMLQWLYLFMLIPFISFAAESKPKELMDVGITSQLGTQLNLKEEFLDGSGQKVNLSHFVDGTKPVILVFNYYGCPMLCGLLLNGVRDSIQQLDWQPGEHYKIVTISIDPKEDADLAAAKKNSMMDSLKTPEFRALAEKNWHFLVGINGSEARLASQVGFRYKWVQEEKQYAHAAAIFLLSPSGKLTRVLQGIEFPKTDLKFGLLEAGEGKVGTFTEKLSLFCYHYDPKENKYALLATRLVSAGGALTLVILLASYFVWLYRSRKKGFA